MRSSTRHARNLFLVYATSLALGSGGGQAWAQTWDGQTNSNWNNPANWNPDGVPGVAATATIAGAGGTNQPIVNTNQTVALTNVTAGTLTVAATLTSNVNVSGTGTMTINAGNQVTGSVQVDPADGMVNNNGTISGSLIVNGGTANNAGAVTGSTSINAGTLNLNAGTNLADGQVLQVNGGTLNVNATDTAGSLSGTGGTIAFGSGGRLNFNQAVAGTYAGGMSGNFGFSVTYLEKLGAGTLTLTGTSSVTGAGRFEITQGTLRVSGGNAISNNSIVSIGAATLELLSNETIGALAAADPATINLNGNTLTLAGIGSGAGAVPGGTIIGTGNLVYSAAGLATTFTIAHSYTGDTTISNGTFGLGINNLINDASDVVINGGTLSMQGFNDTVASVSLQSGAITGTGTLTSNSAFDVRSGSVSAVLGGAVGLNKTTAGTISLSGANTYSGVTTISSGTLRAANATALGTTAAGTTVVAGATVEIAGGFAVAEAFSIAGNGVNGGGAIRIVSDAPSLDGAITLTADARINSDSPGNSSGFPAFITGAITGTNRNLTLGGSGILVVTGAINLGTGTLTKDGTGQIALAGSNTFGALNISGGILQLSGGAAIDNAALVTITTSADLLVSASETIGGLAGEAPANVFLEAGQTLTVGSNNGSSTFAGGISSSGTLTKIGTGTLTLTGANTYTGITTISGGTLQIGNGGTTGSLASQSIVNNAALVFNRSDAVTYGGAISGAGSLTKTGSGLLILTGTHSHTGGTTADNGTLAVNGTLSASSTTTITGTATLGGNGTIVGPVNVTGGGQIYPATGQIGTLRTGPLTFASGTTLRIDVLGATSHDKLESTGAVDLGGATLAMGLGASLPPGSAPVTILEKQSAGPITGTFAGLSQGSVFNAGGSIFRISYIGGDGNDVTLAAEFGNLTRSQADAAFDLFAATGAVPGSGTFSGPGVSGGTFTPGGAVGVNTITFTPNTGSPVTFTLTVTESPSLVVTTTSDTTTNTDGQTSLREALAYLNTGNAGTNPVITFDPTVFATAQTIQLTQGQLGLSRNVTIAGPGADRLTVRGNWNGSTSPPSGSRIFLITGGVTVEISGLTLANGSAAGDAGGAIFNFGNTLTLRRCVIRDCFASNSGGGVTSQSQSGRPAALRVIECAVIGNVANFGGGINCIWNGAASTLLVSQSLIAQNSSRQTTPNLSGGGIFCDGGTSTTIVGSSIVGNTSAAPAGGGIFVGVINVPIAIQNSLVVGNTAAGAASDLSGGTVTDKGGNLIGLPNGTTLPQLLRVDANGRPLAASHGGPTPSVALVAGSPALDAGVNLTTLTTALADGTTTSLTLGDTSGLYVGATIQIGAEQMTVVTVPSATTCTVTRGANGSSATAHAADAPVNYATDQRGQPRIRKGSLASANARVDIGAYEAAPSRLHIDQSVAGGDGSGDSWANAMPELRTATAMAQTDPNVSEIWVARGTYKPAVAGGDRAATFQLRNGLAIYGGFTSGQTQLSQRDSDPATNGTRLSGDLNGNDGANFANNGENSYHVTVGSNTDATAVLDGFTVSGGNADGVGNNQYGAGMLNLSGSPSLTHVTISGNSASGFGGGIVNVFSSSPTLSHVTISGNSAGFNGGGIFNGNSSSPTLSHVTLSGNSAGIDGGGILNFSSSSPTLTNVTISGNSATVGGGVCNESRSSPTLRNCILWGNSGGEIVNSGGSATVSDSLVQGGYGGGTNILDADPQFVSPITAAAPTTTGNLRLRATSPAVNVGNNHVTNPALPATDLDGAPRIVGGTVDLGAYELIAPPTLTTNALTVTTSGTLNDLAALTGAAPGGGVFTGTGVSVDGNGKYVFNSTGLALGTQVPVTYTVNGPNGTSNQSSFTITVTETPSLTVTTTSDTSTNTDGQTSLREAIAHAATLSGPQTITFSNSTANGAVNFHDGTARTIALRTQLNLFHTGRNITLAGPGADRLKISGGGLRSVFSVNVNTELTLSDLTVADGVSVVSDFSTGGAILNSGTLTLLRCVVRDSGAFIGVLGTRGGGLFTRGKTTIIGSTFTGNAVGRPETSGFARGAAIYATATARVKVINSTISGNTAVVGSGTAEGAGIYAEGSGEVIELINTTVTANTATVTGGAGATGGGVFGNVTARNSIIAGNSSSHGSPNLAGNVTSLGHNLIFVPGSSITFSGNTTGDLTDVEPLLGPLQDNGGPTLTHALLAGSPAINAGDPAFDPNAFTPPLEFDQRGPGFPRVVIPRIDIGAFESPNAPPVNSMPLAQTTREDTALVFSTANGNALSVADDSASITTVVSITAGTGTLTATTGGGATITTNGTASVSIQGSVTQVNAALEGLRYLPTADANGAAYTSLSLTTTDDGTLSDSDTVVISVTAVNDTPSFVKGTDITVLEDAGPQTVANWATSLAAGPANESTQTLTFQVSADSPALFATAPAIGPNGTLTFTPAANAFGQTTVTVTVQDNGGTTNGGIDTSPPETFTITLTPVNDTPSFVKGTDITVLEDAGPQTVANWATSLSAGPANESTQTLTFQVSADTPALFSTAPAIAPNGTLTFTPALDARGQTTVTVRIRDNGGTTNGGIDTSSPQTFVLTIEERPSLIVTTTSDQADRFDGETSLREALLFANSNADPSAVTFDPVVFASRQTLVTTGALSVASDLSITAPAAGVILAHSTTTSYTLVVSNGTAQLQGLTIQGTGATGNSGAVSNSGTLTVRNCLFLNSQTGVFNAGRLTLQNSTLSGHSTGLHHSGESLTVQSCTLTGNTTHGILNSGTGGATVRGSLVVGNSSNLSGTIDATGPNLTTGSATDAGLAALADNGGPTLTHALLPGSPAIDAGDPAFDPNAFTPPLTTDQRGPGFPRVLRARGGSVNGRIDLGAFEAPVPLLEVLGNAQVLTNGQTTPATADHTDFGPVPFASTDTLTRVFTLRAAVTGPLTLVNAALSGPHANDFEVTRQSGGALAAGDTTTLEIRFRPGGYGARSALVTLGGLDADHPPFTFAIGGFGDNSAPAGITLDPPILLDGSLPGMEVGQFTVTDADTGDTHQLALVPGDGDTDNAAFRLDCRRLLLNNPISIATQNRYSLRLRATDDGDPSKSVEVVFELPVIVLQPEQSVSGPLTLNRETGLFEQMLRVTNPGLVTLAGVRVTVMNLPPTLQLWNRTHPVLPILEDSTLLGPREERDLLIQFYSPLRRLPPGWTPIYRVETIYNGIPPLAGDASGQYAALIDRSTVVHLSRVPNLGGRVTLSVSRGGIASGVVREGAVRRPFRSRLTVDTTLPHLPALRTPLSRDGQLLELVFLPDQNQVRGRLLPASASISVALSPPIRVEGELSGWRRIWNARTQPATSYLARHHLALENEDLTQGPQGFGYLVASVPHRNGRCVLNGRLPDGQVITSTTFVGPQGQVPLYSPLYRNAGSCRGWLTLTPGSTAPLNNTAQGSLDWLKPATPSGPGFGPLDLRAEGGAWQRPAPGALLMNLTPSAPGTANALVELSLGPVLVNQAVRVGSPSRTTLLSALTVLAPNPSALALSAVSSRTGLWGGTLNGGRIDGLIVPTQSNGTLGFGFYLHRNGTGRAEFLPSK